MRLIALLSLSLLLTACVQTTTVDTVRADRETVVDSVILAPGADFSRFSKLQPVPLEIYYVEGQHRPDAEDLARIRQIFRTAFLAEIGDDYPIVDAPGPDVLHVKASLVDRQPTASPVDTAIGVGTPALIAQGHLTFMMELSDSLTGETLLQAADREKDLGEVDESAVDSNWQRTEEAAARWARLFRAFLDENLGAASF